MPKQKKIISDYDLLTIFTAHFCSFIGCSTSYIQNSFHNTILLSVDNSRHFINPFLK